MSKRQSSNNIGRRSRGFTLIELLVVIAIITLLLSILLPSLQRTKELARQVICKSQLKQIGTAFCVYTNDYKRYLPVCYEDATTNWFVALGNPYLGFSQEGDSLFWFAHSNKTVYSCPSNLIEHPEAINRTTYGMNLFAGTKNSTCTIRRTTDANKPSKTLLAADGYFYHPGKFWTGHIQPSWRMPGAIHSGDAHILYVDFSVGRLAEDEIPNEYTSDEGKCFWKGN